MCSSCHFLSSKITFNDCAAIASVLVQSRYVFCCYSRFFISFTDSQEKQSSLTAMISFLTSSVTQRYDILCMLKGLVLFLCCDFLFPETHSVVWKGWKLNLQGSNYQGLEH